MICSTSVYGFASTFEMTVKRGGSTVAAVTCGANSARAGSMSALCHAPLTLSGTTRFAPASIAYSPATRTASASPLMTIWPGRVEVRELHAARAALDRARDRGAQQVGRQPEHRGHRAAATASPRGASPDRARSPASSAVSNDSAPASVSEQYSPNEWPALTTGSSASPTAFASATLVTKIAGCA